jgi:hypothetical protein
MLTIVAMLAAVVAILAAVVAMLAVVVTRNSNFHLSITILHCQ